jgi:diguanylate cyclase (GGDEF)-like protein/PAS domain S-box-containing protein
MNSKPAKSNVLRFEKRLRNHLEIILDSMPVAVSWANLDNQQIIYLNKTFTDIFGYVLGDHPTVTDWIEKTYINPEHVERAAQMWYPHFGSTSMEPIGIDQVEVDVLCKDGSVRTTLLGGMILPQNGWALATFVDITQRKQAEERIQKMAMEDPLTGLPNRRAFTNSLKSSIARMQRMQEAFTVLLLLDLDCFKHLNDTFGHDCGDCALQILADRLKQVVREGDNIYRLGGDEFAVIIDSSNNEQTAIKVAERILAASATLFQLDDHEVSLGMSIGIGICPTDAADEQALYKRADEALYRAKDKGRGCWSR